MGIIKIKTGKLLKSIETATDTIEVRENKRYRWMCFDKDVIQTLINRKEPHDLTLGHISILMYVFNFFKAPKKILMMGLGGGALIHAIKHQYPNVHTTSVEISEAVIQLAKEFFYLSDNSEHYDIIHADINEYITRSKSKFDITFIDMYAQGKMPKFYFQKKFHTAMKQKLKVSGVAVYNLLCDSADNFESIVKLIREVFHSQTLCIPVDNYHNVILFAFNSDRYKEKIYSLEKQRKLINLTYDIELGLISNH